jgi:hypothetical protein
MPPEAEPRDQRNSGGGAQDRHAATLPGSRPEEQMLLFESGKDWRSLRSQEIRAATVERLAPYGYAFAPKTIDAIETGKRHHV